MNIPLPTAVMKYFEPIDKFVRLRCFTREQARVALTKCPARSKKPYVAWVVETVVVGWTETVKPALDAKFGPEYHEDLLISIYGTCIELNPVFELHQTIIPIYPETQTGEIPDGIFDAPKRERPLPLDFAALLNAKVVGQRDAVESVRRLYQRTFVGLRDRKRPVGSMMFIGPTGVGKTELAKSIADVAFGRSLIRIDCSEFCERHEYAKLIGSPPGYIGHEKGGYLTTEIIENPQSVVLFDEIEKADSRIYSLLLQAMDEGHLTDSHGVKADLTETMIILTSNLGTGEIESLRDRVGFSRKSVRSIDQAERVVATNDALEDHFPLEFLNRLDEVIIFRELEESVISRIVTIFLDKLKSRLAIIGHRLSVSRAATIEIARQGFDPKWGAREIGRTVEELVEDPITDLLVESSSNKKISFKVGFRAGELTVRK